MRPTQKAWVPGEHSAGYFPTGDDGRNLFLILESDASLPAVLDSVALEKMERRLGESRDEPDFFEHILEWLDRYRGGWNIE